MIKQAFLLVVVVAALLLLHSCTKEERDPCLQPRSTVLRAHAYRHADTGKAVMDTLLPNPLLIPLTGQSTQYVFGGVKRISTFTLSLSNIADSSVWIIRPDSAFLLEDTFTIYYQRQLRFLSNSCGYTNYYNLDSIHFTRHALDSARINHADVTTDANVEHLKLFY
jgi:hypothetical protein